MEPVLQQIMLQHYLSNPTSMKAKSVLIIDDSVIIAERIMHILQQEVENCTVNYATAISEARQMLQQTVPEIILLDINLGDGNGMDFLHYLKHSYPSVKVIMLTTEVHAAYRLMSQKLGALHFLDKSNDFDKLAQIVSQL